MRRVKGVRREGGGVSLWRKCADWAVLTDGQREGGSEGGGGVYGGRNAVCFPSSARVHGARRSLPRVKGHRRTNAPSLAVLEQSDSEPKSSSLPNTRTLGEE